jgi:hypothetical protein
MVILKFQNNFNFFPISCEKKFCPPKTTLLGKFGTSFDTNYVMCRNVEICKLIKNKSQRKKIYEGK